MADFFYFLAIWAIGTIAIVLHQTDHYKRHSADYWLEGAKWPWLLITEIVGWLVRAFLWAKNRWIDK